jgi:opacity protein-like surface antigen
MRITTAIKALCLSAVLATMSANAETHYKPHVSVGGHAGMSLSQMSFSPSVEQGWQGGPMFGLRARYAEEKIFGVFAELNVDQRGWKENFDDNPELSYSRKLTYIDLPIMTHIYFGGKRSKCFVNLGPQFSYMIAESISSNFDYANPYAAGIPSTREVEQLVMPIKNKFDYGIAAGLGTEFYLTPRHSIDLEARFYYGLGNIFSAKKADTFSASRNMNIQVSLGYWFRLM